MTAYLIKATNKLPYYLIDIRPGESEYEGKMVKVTTTTWTKEKTKAIQYQNREEAEKMIKDHHALRFAQVIEV